MNYLQNMYNSIIDNYRAGHRSLKRDALVGLTLLVTALYASGCQGY